MSGATFTAEALLSIGLEPSMSPSVRLVMLTAERADRAGLATFDDGEIRDLFTDETGKRPDSKAVGHWLHAAAKGGIVLPGSTTEEIRLDTSLVQPEGLFPEAGDRYGELVLVHEVDTGKWLCACDCGSRRTYMLPYLESGITSSCAQHR